MIQKKDIATIPFLKKSAFKGSHEGLRFLIQKKEEEDKLFLEVVTWKEPFCFEKTPEEEKTYQLFDFKAEELENIVEWLNREVERMKK